MNRHLGSRLRAASVAAACVALAAAILAPAAPAKTIAPKLYDGVYPAATFDGTGSVGAPAPFFGNGANYIAVDEQSGNVYVGSPSATRLYKFDASGNPQPFTEVAPDTALVQSFESADLFVDNSGGPHQGRIYAISYDPSAQKTTIAAYEPSGAPAPNYPFPLVGASAGEVAPDGSLWLVNVSSEKLEQFDSTTATPTGKTFTAPLPYRMAIDSRNYFYVSSFTSGLIKKYNAAGEFQELIDTERGSGYADLAVDRSNDHFFAGYESQFFEYDQDGAYLAAYGGSEGAYPGLGGARALVVNASSGKIYVSNGTFPPTIDRFAPVGTTIVPDVLTGGATPEGGEATITASVDPDGVDTADCHFDWGPTRAYTAPDIPCVQGNVLGGSGDLAVSAILGDLAKGTTYHYRISASNANGRVVPGNDRTFVAQGIPTVSGEFASKVNSDGVRINATIDPEGGPTSFHIEYGTDSSYGSVAPVPGIRVLGLTSESQPVTAEIGSLEPETEYHYKVVATNAAGVGESGEDHTFKTFPSAPEGEECPNGLERQQTGSAHLLDCRAYELVSAQNLNGYDVESSIVPGQEPFAGHPRASDRVLYGVHDGGIPGTGSPTNKGIDPYLATRAESGWSTKYIGIPADGTPSTSPFASPLLGADETLETFAFGGEAMCNPCFGDGTSGIPLRGADGELVQAMEGSEEPAGPRLPDGLVQKSISADGSHLVFGSTDQFEPDGNANGDVSIYDRDLETGETQVVSKFTDGTNLPCLQGAGECHSPGNRAGIASLDISRDGSRIVVAQRVDTDGKGNHYWHPYMHVGAAANAIDLAPGTTSGVLFDGMTADGSKVFLTTVDQLLPAEDTDESADIYVAGVGATTATLSLLSTDSSGAPVNDDGCTPANEPNTWNSADGDGKCGALAFAGGAGLATDSGAFYFLSPEQLDGSQGEPDQANLYLVEPGGNPHFVAVLDSSLGKPEAGRLPYELDDQDLVTGLANPESLAVDQRNGDVYVLQRNNSFAPSTISRYDSSGAPKAFPDAEVYLSGNAIVDVESWYFAGRDQLAVDSHVGSPLEGAIYSTSSFGGRVMVYANEGEKLGEIPTIGGNEVCGVSVDPSSGLLYVAELGFGGTQTRIRQLDAVSGAAPVTAANYTEKSLTTANGGGCPISANSQRLYASATDFGNTGPTRRYLTTDFVSVPLTVEGFQIATKSSATATDPASKDVYVDQVDRIVRFDSRGNNVETFGVGEIGTGSRGVAVDSDRGYVYVSDPQAGTIVRYHAPLPPQRPIDNEAITHAADQAAARNFGDFQVTPDGRFAAFASTQALTGVDAFGQPNVFHYTAADDEIACVTCVATKERPNGTSSLASHGLSLIDDGRLFFDTYKALVLRDTDGVRDAYEWSDGKIQLISTGASQFDSGMLGASADGRDAFFFTRESLTPVDANGSVMRIYDAREGGGRFIIPPPPQCAASDECHGPGSPVPPSPTISSLAGTPDGMRSKKPGKCRKGFVKKKGKCVKKKSKHKKSKRRKGAGR